MCCLRGTCPGSGCHQATSRNEVWLWRLYKPLGKSPGPLLTHAVHSGLSQWGVKVAFLGDGKKNLKTLWGPQELGEFTRICRYCRQSLTATVCLGVSALRGWLKFALENLYEIPADQGSKSPCDGWLFSQPVQTEAGLNAANKLVWIGSLITTRVI